MNGQAFRSCIPAVQEITCIKSTRRKHVSPRDHVNGRSGKSLLGLLCQISVEHGGAARKLHPQGLDRLFNILVF